MPEDNNRTNMLKKIVAFVGGPSSLVFSTAAIILGVFGDNIVEYFNKRENAYIYAVAITAVAYLLVIIFAIILWGIFFARKRNDEIAEVVNQQPQVCRDIQYELVAIQEAAKHLQSIVTESALKDGLVPRRMLDDLEASITKDRTIYILTSKFILEKTSDFRLVIIRNFRKGVKYIYYVPTKPGVQKDYFDRVQEWFRDFSKFTASKQNAELLLQQSERDATEGHVWNEDYLAYIHEAVEVFALKTPAARKKRLDNIKESLKTLFLSQLETFQLSDSLFYITVALYEIEIGKWRAIIKLPTESSAEEFVAFSVSGVNTLDREHKFIECIESLHNATDPQVKLPPSVFS